MNIPEKIKHYCEHHNFHAEAAKRLRESKPYDYVIVSVDIDNFKYINELFGYGAGDLALKTMTAHFSTFLNAGELFTKFDADVFAFLLKNTSEKKMHARLAEIANIENIVIDFLPTHYNFVLSGGIYIVDDVNEKVSTMLDFATIVRKQTKGKYSSSFIYYNDQINEDLKWKKEVTLTMDSALKNKDFEMFLQPKIMISENIVIGAEALVRWNSKKNGLVMPDKFISIMEQNGFIKLLDFYMLEQACIFLRKCIDEQVPVVPISVNFSKVHIGTPNLAESIFDVVQKFDIEPRLIEIELTESIFAYNFDELVTIANQFKAYGFKVSLDDFGSQYSSLNYLKNFPVDIIKIDKSFLNSSSESEKGRLLLTKILELIKSLRLTTVMEGVETKEQVELLKKLNCDIGQGYFYSRPMPSKVLFNFLSENKALVHSHVDKDMEWKKKRSTGFDLPSELKLDNWELYILGQNIDVSLLKTNINNNDSITYSNIKALEVLGYTSDESSELIGKNIFDFAFKDDVEEVNKIKSHLIESGTAIKFKIRVSKKNGDIIFVDGTSSCVKDKNGELIGLHTFRDVTSDVIKDLKSKKDLSEKETELDLIYSTLPAGIIQYQYNEKMLITYANLFFCNMLGYKREELIGKSAIDFIHPDDLERVREKVDKLLKDEVLEYTTSRFLSKDNKVVWVLSQGQKIKIQNGVPIIAGFFIDITVEKKNENERNITEEKYKLILEQSDDIIFEWDFATDVISFSEKYNQIFGYDAITNDISNNQDVISKAHPDDVEILKKWLSDTYKNNRSGTAEFRLLTARGDYFWTRVTHTTMLDADGKPMRAIGVFSNVNKEKSILSTLKAKSQQDSLTKLCNKEETHLRIEKYLSEDNGNAGGALIILDVDNFKDINDNLGHQFGDSVLIDIANKMSTLFKTDDVIGRIGGDEFAIFVTGTNDKNFIREKAKELLEAFKATHSGENKQYSVSVSVGIAYYPDQADNLSSLYSKADIALYVAKNKGKHRFTEYSSEMKQSDLVQNKTIEVLERSLANHYDGDLIYNVFELLYETNDIKATIDLILRVVGERFKVDRAYIFEYSSDNQFVSNTYEWCRDGVRSEMDTLQNISYLDVKDFVSLYGKDGVFFCSDFSEIDEFSAKTLTRQGIKSIIHCGIYDNSKIKGFIGFDDCEYKRVWTSEEIAVLSFIAKIMSVFILNKQLSSERWETYENHMSVLDNLSGYVYVIDTDTYEMLYVNSAIKELGEKIGQKCHQMAFGCDSPCEVCPVRLLGGDVNNATLEIYSEKINGYVLANASKIKWIGRKNVALICCTDISKYKE